MNPKVIKVSNNLPCKKCGKVRMIPRDRGICIPCLSDKSQDRYSDADRAWQMMVHSDHLSSLRICYLCGDHIDDCCCPRDGDY